jgi:16S rRNA processing protein RimM
VVVNVETDFPLERFQPGAGLFVERRGAIERVTLTTVRFQQGRPIVGIAGVDTMTEAERLAGLELRVPIADLAPLPEGTFYRHDLIGCRVETTTGREVGLVEDVEGTIGGSRLVVRSAHGEVLIPLAASICTSIDAARKRIIVDPPEGLLELNV